MLLLDQAAKDKVIRWLEEHWKAPGAGQCPVCKSDRWFISEEYVQVLTLAGAGTSPGRTYPGVLLVCLTCGNTPMFSAIVMGIFKAGGDVPGGEGEGSHGG